MYQVEAWSSLRRLARGARPGTGRAIVSANVVALGVTSMFTDIASEMVNTVLPAYLVLQLGLSPLAFGLLDGLAQGITAVLHLVTGSTADRLRRCKSLAGTGYALSAAAKLGLLLAGPSWAAIAALVSIDRLGKGIRTVPRDLLISLSTPTGSLATAFGVHRALDSAGAMLGPVLALVLLSSLQAPFDVVFAVSLAIAVCGVAALVLFVEDRTPASVAAHGRRFSLTAALRVRGIRPLVCGVLALGAATIGDAFLYLVLQRQVGFSAGLMPLLYIGTAGAFLLMSLPVGWVADLAGRHRTFLGGYVCLGAGYAAAWSASNGGWLSVALVLLLLGTYYAATDGVLMALAGGLVDDTRRGSGMALLTTALGAGRLAASMLFGAAWSTWGTGTALALFGALLAAAVAGCAVLLPRLEQT